MKRALSRTLALIGWGLATFAVTPAHAQTTANGPYYATPSWDQTLPSNTRFIVLSNMNSEAVLDRETGLVWQRSPGLNLPQRWQFATASCTGVRTGNRGGWRLPTVQELGSLMDVSATAAPALPSGHPFTDIPAGDDVRFWTTNQQVGTEVHLWVGWTNRLFGTFMVALNGVPVSDNATQSIWCVRAPGLQPGPQ